MNNLKALIQNAKRVVAFTGAGISTESGIPDFRSTLGIYQTGEFEGYKPEDILTRKMIKTKPELVLQFYKHRLMKMVEKEPNRSHFALKKLEEMEKLRGIITQNIDNLHRKAGSRGILELHGNGTRFKCSISCGAIYTYKQFVERIEKNKKPMCDCQMVPIRPDVVLFDECLDDDIFDKSYWESKTCDLMISIGSSLLVQPAAGLVDEIPQDAKLVIINNDPTPYDSKADLIIRENCGEVLEKVINELYLS